MKIGLFTTNQQYLDTDMVKALDEQIAMVHLARDNGWAGIVVYGCIRDSAVIAGIDIGLKAIATTPRIPNP